MIYSKKKNKLYLFLGMFGINGKSSGEFCKLQQKHIDAAHQKRETLTDDEQQRLSKLEGIREDLKDKPSELKRYEDKLKEAIIMNAN